MSNKKIKIGNINPNNLYVVNIGFLKLKLPVFFGYLRNVLAAMTDNINYTNPAPSIASIQVLVDLYNVAKQNKKTLLANRYLQQIKDQMKLLAIYIANTCQNDPVILNSSGMRANKKGRGTKKKMSKMTDVKLGDNGFSGEFVATYPKMNGARIYKGYVKLSGVKCAVYVLVEATDKLKMVFKGYPRGTILDVCITATGSLGEGPKSNVISFVVR